MQVSLSLDHFNLKPETKKHAKHTQENFPQYLQHREAVQSRGQKRAGWSKYQCSACNASFLGKQSLDSHLKVCDKR